MHKLKFSFALAIAILATGLTIASKANKLGARTITACFETVTLTNAAAVESLYNPALDEDCATTKANVLIGSGAFNFLKVDPTQTPSNERVECPDEEIYCCIEFTELSITPPDPSKVPVISLSGVSSKWQVSAVRCELP